LRGIQQINLSVRGQRAEHAQLANIIFASEQCINIPEISVGCLPERPRNFLLLTRRKKSISRERFAALDRSDEVSVNGAAHEPARARDFIDGFTVPKAPDGLRLAVV
jgi:hypothetical protein